MRPSGSNVILQLNCVDILELDVLKDSRVRTKPVGCLTSCGGRYEMVCLLEKKAKMLLNYLYINAIGIKE